MKNKFVYNIDNSFQAEEFEWEYRYARPSPMDLWLLGLEKTREVYDKMDSLSLKYHINFYRVNQATTR